MRYTLIILAVLIFSGCDRNKKSDAYGTFEAVEVTVSAEANGKILMLNAPEGSLLSRGDTVGLIDTTDLYLKKMQVIQQKSAVNTKLATIESQIAVQEQQKENLMVEKRRLDNLFKEGAATQKQMDDIKGNLDLLDKQIAASRIQKSSVVEEMKTMDIQVDQVSESLRKCHITNPIDGTILTRYAEQGEITAFGRPLYKIANLQEMELKVYIGGDQLPHLKIGQEVEVLIDESKKENRKLQGTVTWISEVSEFTPKTIQTKEERVNLVYAAKVRVINDGSIKIGMPGEINFMPASE
jgi:HlyD family secretion protein